MAFTRRGGPLSAARKFAWLFLLVSILSHQASSQSKAKHDPYADLARQDSNPDLAAVVDWGTDVPPILPDPAPKVSFHLETSWIPGGQHRGMFRYRIYGAIFASAIEHAKSPTSYKPESIAATIRQIHACDLTLILFDKDSFVLRKIDVPFSYGVNDQSEIVSLNSNDAAQMDAKEYRQVNSWSMSWSCPGR
jgi:hypothetical protein